MNKYVKSLGLISLFLTVLACGWEDLDEFEREGETKVYEDRKQANMGEVGQEIIDTLNKYNEKLNEISINIETLKNNDKNFIESVISLALRKPVLFNKIYSDYGKTILNSVDFKKHAQCKLSFLPYDKLRLDISFKSNDFEINHTDDDVSIDESVVKNLETFVSLGGKLTGFDKNKMKFCWKNNKNILKIPEFCYYGLKLTVPFSYICRILKCFQLEGEKFGLENCLKYNKFFGLEVSSVNSSIPNNEKLKEWVSRFVLWFKCLEYSFCCSELYI